MNDLRRDSRGGPDREWFQKEKKRMEDEIREEMQEAVSNVYILNQNIEHLNDVGQEVVAISSVWVTFLRRTAASASGPAR
uniref:DASH complex subunit DAD1 n=1 Tax=Peronospora matthiolae TaxID=2874970 RepID=A0AAV1V6L3_9STRA